MRTRARCAASKLQHTRLSILHKLTEISKKKKYLLLRLFSVSSSMSVQSNSKYKGFDRAFCIRMKSTLTKRGCQFKQSTGHRVSESESTRNQFGHEAHTKKPFFTFYFSSRKLSYSPFPPPPQKTDATFLILKFYDHSSCFLD